MSTLPLIPITPAALGGKAVQLVDARLLYRFLDVGRDFTNWIKGRIEEYEFEKGRDYETFDSPKPANQTGRGGDRRSVDYFLTLDMAKELAMVERTPRGRQARRYFIECERQLRQLQARRDIPTSAPACLTRGERQAINHQAWAEVAGDAYAAFHRRREALISAHAQAKVRGKVPVYLPQGFWPTWAQAVE
jgi:phage anti-repressor protein